MIRRVTLAAALVLGAVLVAQAAHSRSEAEEAERLLASIQQSLREAMPGAEISTSLTAADLLNLDPPNLYADRQWLSAANAAPGQRALKEKSKRVARAAEPDDDAEEVPADRDDAPSGEAPGQDAPGQDAPGCEDTDGQQPPATGLRRWVIRIRNIMFGRRDLEGSEGGEAEGDPESGRTWVESLAHWFAHGIKRMLVRISGGEQPTEAGAEAGVDPEASTTASNKEDASSEGPWTALPAPAPGRKEPTTSPSGPASEATTSAPEAKVPPKASSKVPSKAKAKVPNKIPTEVPTKAPTRSPPPSDTVYDDEAYGSKPRATFDETNELS